MAKLNSLRFRQDALIQQDTLVPEQI